MKTPTTHFRISPSLLTFTSLLVAFLLCLSTAQPTFAGTMSAAPSTLAQVPNQQTKQTTNRGPSAVGRYGVKWIDVDLSAQRLIAYEGRTPVFNVRVSTGTRKYPTVQGTFRVYVRLLSTRMRGGTGSERYDLPNVPHTMYFFRGYGIHGTYWHNNFGRPMSHGCVNLSRANAQWLYNWTPVGTKVVVHQ